MPKTNLLESKLLVAESGQYITRCGTWSTSKDQVLNLPIKIGSSINIFTDGAKYVPGCEVVCNPVIACHDDGIFSVTYDGANVAPTTNMNE